MFELNKERTQPQSERESSATDTASNDSLTVDDLISLGFASREVESLLAARRRYLSGELNDWSDSTSRIRFAKWLYEHGMIDG
jgi:hypothetical protein